ncbi:MAG: hypothetical protein CM1200mP41_00100 [Gammaproteobacteria bacterium]|nr:MAG: hypothetical protein CM1200mP41_00100 [Gammaproteobacteria bacterium]
MPFSPGLVIFRQALQHNLDEMIRNLAELLAFVLIARLKNGCGDQVQLDRGLHDTSAQPLLKRKCWQLWRNRLYSPIRWLVQICGGQWNSRRPSH